MIKKLALMVISAMLVIASGAQAQADKQTINLKQTDILVLIDLVGEITGKTFVVDPRVQGQVTVVSQKPLDKDEIYEVFLSVLRINGFTAVQSGNVVKILPDANARVEGDLGGDVGAPDELVTRVLPITHLSASEVLNLIKPLMSPTANLSVHSGGNALLVSDRAGNVDRLRQILSRIDTKTSSTVDAIALDHANAAEVAQVIGQLETAETRQGSVVADARTNTLLVSGDPAYRLRARTLVAHLDTPLPGSDSTEVIYLRYASAESIMVLIDPIARSLAGLSNAAEAPNSKVSVQHHRETNALIVTAPPAVLRQLRQVINQLDIRPAQVHIEGIVAEVGVDASKELGIQWQLAEDNFADGGLIGGTAFSNRQGQGNILNATGALSSGNPVQVLGGLSALGNGLNLGYVRGIGTLPNGEDFVQLGALARALRSDATSNVLSEPSITTLDHKEAKLLVGQEVPFLTGQYAQTGVSQDTLGGIAGSVNPFQTIQRNNVGIELAVTPHVNEGGSIVLDISLLVSSVAPSSQGAVDLITNKREVKTSVMVEDGRTIVIGGLIDDDVQQVVSKVPGLGSVPVVGNLFKFRSSQQVRRNLMVFIRPQVLHDASAEARVTGSKYSAVRRMQLEQQQRPDSMVPAADLPLLPDAFDLEPVVIPDDQQ